MNAIALIGAASGWGAGFRHTEDGPPALKALGLTDWLARGGVAAEWRAMVETERRWHDDRGITTRSDVFGLVARHSAALATAVAHTMAERKFPVVIGGDHAIAMGTWGGVARGMARRRFGLVWLDAHLDAHTVETTPSMNPHGMGAAALLGHGERAFLKICGGAIRPENLCFVGVRSYEAGEMALLKRLGVRIIEMPEVKARGIGPCLEEARFIATADTAGFGITIDLDGFDPKDAPGIGLKCDDGLRAEPTVAALRDTIANHPSLKAIEIVEYIPEFDEDLRTAHLVRDLLLALRAPARQTAPKLDLVGTRA